MTSPRPIRPRRSWVAGRLCPLIFAPTGFTRLMHHEGEPAVARVAARMGIPYVLSTMGTTSPEDVAAAAPTGQNWFQLYLWRDRDASLALVERARAAGFGALMLTVDTPVAGARLRDARNGFSIPPALTVKTLLDIALHPGWWFDVLTTEPLQFASLDAWHGPGRRPHRPAVRSGAQPAGRGLAP